jgi:glycosyltransferase involved in cell wall biosynthesis
MKIVYDAQVFVEQEYGGISRYICALASHLSRLPDMEVKIVAPLHINAYLRALSRDIAVGRYVPRLPKTARLIRTLGTALCTPVASLIHPDLVHETYYAEQALCRAKVPHVLTVYDMIEERFPESFPLGYPLARRKRCAVNRADHIFCISENTRRDLLDTYKFPEDRVSVTYLGYDALVPSSLSAQDLVGGSPYIFFVAGRHGYKNFEGLIRAYAASAWLQGGFRIVCFGGGTFSAEEQTLMAELGLTSAQVEHVAGGDDRLAALYQGAAALVYPSKYEGFGIPPLEAMSLDCPVICSQTSSIPEVVGQAGEYFDPNDIDSIRVSMERVLQSTERRDELVSLGRVRRELFTWERCAQQTADIYRRLVT